MRVPDEFEHRPVDVGFVILAGVFIAALVVCNIIAGRLITVDLGWLGFSTPFTLSAGALPYPVTFLATDLLSEVYGKRRANLVVVGGLAASGFVLMTLWLGTLFGDAEQTLYDERTYELVFSSAPKAIAASMVAYLAAQFLDVKLFHFWKDLTRNKHLWLRNNASTIASQLVDSVLVVTILFWTKMNAAQMTAVIWDLWLFKLLVALADTPFFYAGVWWFRRWRPAPL